jgi:hypothetical protein
MTFLLPNFFESLTSFSRVHISFYISVCHFIVELYKTFLFSLRFLKFIALTYNNNINYYKCKQSKELE